MANANTSSIADYLHDELIARFAETYKVSAQDAADLFEETKKWLFACGRAGELELALFEEAFAIDLMWHTFLLFTRDYQEFCERYCGGFVHHTPRTRAQKLEFERRLQQSPDATKLEEQERLRPTFEFLYDTLGAETLAAWVEELPARFTSLR